MVPTDLSGQGRKKCTSGSSIASARACAPRVMPQDLVQPPESVSRQPQLPRAARIALYNK